MSSELRAGLVVEVPQRIANDVRVSGVATDVAAGVAAAAHGARVARGVQRAGGGRGAGAAPHAHRQAAAGQAAQGPALVRRPHRRHQRRA